MTRTPAVFVFASLSRCVLSHPQVVKFAKAHPDFGALFTGEDPQEQTIVSFLQQVPRVRKCAVCASDAEVVMLKMCKIW